MKYKYIAIRDRLSEEFMLPGSLVVNEKVGCRAFVAAVKAPEKNIANEELLDRELWCLGDFDTVHGTLTGTPHLLMRARDALVKEEGSGE